MPDNLPSVEVVRFGIDLISVTYGEQCAVVAGEGGDMFFPWKEVRNLAEGRARNEIGEARPGDDVGGGGIVFVSQCELADGQGVRAKAGAHQKPVVGHQEIRMFGGTVVQAGVGSQNVLVAGCPVHVADKAVLDNHQPFGRVGGVSVKIQDLVAEGPVPPVFRPGCPVQTDDVQ